MTWAGPWTGLAGILSSGALEKTELSTGTLQEGWLGLAGWVGEG